MYQGVFFMKTIKKLAGAAVASLMLATPVLAVDTMSVTFSQFTQQSSDKVAVYSATGTGNALTITNAPVFFVISEYGPTGVNATTMSMQAVSSSLVTSAGPQFEQIGWAGNMTFGNGATNFLTVNFTNAIFSFDGPGGSASMISTDPFDVINYSSNVMNLPGFDLKNFSLAFTGLTPSFTVAANGYGTPFNANIAGSFAGSTGAVPEPSSWAMMLIGFGAVGWSARRRAASVTAAA